jgi:hypothetical protein
LRLFRSHERPLIANRRTGFAGNVLSHTLCRIKPIYCNSIRQQERKCFRLLFVCNPDLRDHVTWLGMLTVPIYLAVKTKQPQKSIVLFAAKVSIFFEIYCSNSILTINFPFSAFV